MISLRVDHKTYGDAPVLQNVSLDIAAGETIAILGPSGIGKSTLLRILAGLDMDFSGQIEGVGRIAMVFQEPALLAWRTALQNITLMTGVSDEKAHRALEETGIADKADHYPGQMSLGQQRRLSLARAIAADPDCLILDEPFASLDDDLVHSMLTLVGALLRARDMSAVLVTHSRREADALAHRILYLRGSPASLRES